MVNITLNPILISPNKMTKRPSIFTLQVILSEYSLPKQIDVGLMLV